MRSFFASLNALLVFVNKNIAVFGLGAGVFITALNVGVRYLAGFYPDIGSLTWAEELARYCFLWSAFCGGAYAFSLGSHIGVKAFVESFPPKIAKICLLVVYLINILFLGFLCFASVMVCLLNYEIGYMSEAFDWLALWVFLLILPFCFFSATYWCFDKLINSNSKD